MAVLWFSKTGQVSYVLGRGPNYTAIRYIGVGRATPMLASTPLFAVIIAVVLTGKRVNLIIAAGIRSVRCQTYHRFLRWMILSPAYAGSHGLLAVEECGCPP